MDSEKIRPLIWESFGRLYGSFGAQGWWPVTVRKGKYPVYRPGVYVPQNKSEVWEIACGAVLTQNTSWKNVTRSLIALGEAGIKSPEDVLSISKSRLAELIRSSGYFRQKAERLRVLANFFVKKDWEKEPTKIVREKLLALKGIGHETADSILLYALGRPVFVVDAYTRRLGERIGFLTGKESYEEVRALFEKNLTSSVPLFNEFHALVVRLSTEICLKKPSCGRCCLNDFCGYCRERAAVSAS